MPSTKKIEEYSKEDLRAALERAAAIVQICGSAVIAHIKARA